MRRWQRDFWGINLLRLVLHFPGIIERNRGDETIPALRDGFDKGWISRRIAQGGTQPLEGAVHTSLKFNEGIGRPNSLLEFFAGNDLSGVLEQKHQQPERLILKFDANALTQQGPASGTSLEYAKAIDGIERHGN